MIRSIIAQLIPYLSVLNFSDRVAGVVTVATRKIPIDGGGVTSKSFPIYPNSPTTCESGDYFTCIPEDKFRSLIYFEEISNAIISETNYVYKMSADVRLVAWFNLKKIGVSVTADTMMRLIVQALPLKVAEFDDVFNVVVHVSGFENKNVGLFTQYSYDEAEQQYLLFPYDYGALRLTVTYDMNKCVDDIEPIVNCGKK